LVIGIAQRLPGGAGGQLHPRVQFESENNVTAAGAVLMHFHGKTIRPRHQSRRRNDSRIEGRVSHSQCGQRFRPHRSGGSVIERAAILAEGRDSEAIFRWITDHAGEPEEATGTKAPDRGLYGARFGGATTAARSPSRYVLPPGTLSGR